MKRGDRILGLALAAKDDKAKATRTTRAALAQDLDGLDLAEAIKVRRQVILRERVRDAADEDFVRNRVVAGHWHQTSLHTQWRHGGRCSGSASGRECAGRGSEAVRDHWAGAGTTQTRACPAGTRSSLRCAGPSAPRSWTSTRRSRTTSMTSFPRRRPCWWPSGARRRRGSCADRPQADSRARAARTTCSWSWWTARPCFSASGMTTSSRHCGCCTSVRPDGAGQGASLPGRSASPSLSRRPRHDAPVSDG